MLNGEQEPADELSVGYDNSAKQYYYKAKKFKEDIKKYGIDQLKTTDAVDENGNGLAKDEKNGWRRL